MVMAPRAFESTRARKSQAPWVAVAALLLAATATEAAPPSGSPRLPRVPEGWTIELVAEAPRILFPTAIVAAPDGAVYLGQDPMDMPGPPTVPIDSVVRLKDGKITVFADKLWAVMGLEWVDDTLYVVHAPYLSAFRDTDGDGRADQRVDLVTGLGPKLPGFSGINDHVASGLRMGIDGFLYIAVGDKGIPKAVGRDGASIQLFGGGVVRIRPDGTGLEVVSTGERNPLSVALSATDEIFTYGNDDDSKQWPNSLTHHIVGAHFGYPYDFLAHPERTLPIMAGQIGGSGTQGVCYNEDGLPPSYRGNLFFTDWGLQTVFRYTIERAGATFRVTSKAPFVTRGDVEDFRPFSMAVTPEGDGFYLVDWAYLGWLADGPQTGRLYRVKYAGETRPAPAPRPSWTDVDALRTTGLDHDALSVRLRSQRALAARGAVVVPALGRRLETGPARGRIHALWALDAIGTPEARRAIRGALTADDPQVRLQAARSSGERRDAEALAPLASLLRDDDSAVRREAAIALGRLGDRAAGAALMAALGDADPFIDWSVRHALRTLQAWDVDALAEALLDPKRGESALRLTNEAWAAPVVEALARAATSARDPSRRAALVANLAGLYRRYPAWSGNWFGTNPLAGTFPQKTEPWDKAAMAAVEAALTRAMADADAAVRLQAIAGLMIVGRTAAPTLRAALAREVDPRNLAALAQGLGVLGDFPSAPALAGLLRDGKKPESVRLAALEGLGKLRGPQALNGRLMLVYDASAPATLVARALPALGRDGVLPPNDLAGFLEHADPRVRAAAIAAIGARNQVPPEVRAAVVARLADPSAEVKRAAVTATVGLQIREAVPRLVALAQDEVLRPEALLALAAMPDPQALPIYLAGLLDRNPDQRRAAETALVAIRDQVGPDLETAAKSGRYSGPAALALERVLARFRPVVGWKVIGPFARTTARVFVGEPSIDFGRTHSGAEGRTIAWQARKGDDATGRVLIDDFKAGAGDRGGFGYDTNGSPDLCAFGYAEVESATDRPALLLVGSSGSLTLTVNEEPVLSYRNFAGRAYAPGSDVVPCRLKAGRNRLLVQSRQGIGAWSFSVQVSEPSTTLVVTTGRAAATPEQLTAFALKNEGDPRAGESLFFDPKGIGCVKCHAAAGKGDATVGPDLTGLALKYDRAEIIRSVLDPSSRIATGYQPAIVATADGKVITGLVRAESDSHLDLVDSEAKPIRVSKSDIEERRTGDVSVMPKGLAESLSPVEFADLISYLAGLKQPPPKADAK